MISVTPDRLHHCSERALASPLVLVSDLLIRLRDLLRRKARIDPRRDFLIREGQRVHCPTHHSLPTRHQPAKLDFGAPAEALLPGTIGKVHIGTERVKPGVHPLVQDGGRDLRQ